ncbi:hypothetical protein K2173_026322 [Erythroxylum novogranatense]|uniref:Uncharacterized protein n=1 Tax=Erythroxylum novogranatense TaxID=1862640 RepID=A0AAV8SCA7_9ROSI|nr:hypothetical protein K2173_026322 [Erythroxylum novogranatense]
MAHTRFFLAISVLLFPLLVSSARDYGYGYGPASDSVKSDYVPPSVPTPYTAQPESFPAPKIEVKPDYTPKPSPDVVKSDYTQKPSSDTVKADHSPKPSSDVKSADYTPKPTPDVAKPDNSVKPSSDEVIPADSTPKPRPDVAKPDYSPKPSSDEVKPGYNSKPSKDVKSDYRAVAKITCSAVGQNGYEATSFSCLTDAKGYFFKTLPDLDDDKLKLTDCKAFLESSPLETCKLPTDVNKGITGAIFSNYRILNDKKIKLFSVGPFFYTSEPASTPGGY